MTTKANPRKTSKFPNGDSVERPRPYEFLGIRIRPLKRTAGYSWRVELGIRHTGGRGAKWQQFRTREEAESFAAGKATVKINQGLAAFDLSDAQRSLARRAFDKLTAQSLPMDDLLRAVNFYLGHHKPAGGDITVTDLVARFISAKRRGDFTKGGRALRPRSLDDIESRASIFSEVFGKQLVKAISTQAVKEWLDDPALAPQTRRNNFTVVSNLFAFALANKFIGSNPLTGLTKPGAPARVPGILTLQQCRDLLDAALAHPELDLGWYVVCGLLLGIRPAELRRLTVGNVRLDEGFLTVPSHAAKTRGIRNVPFAWTVPDPKKPSETITLDAVSAWLRRMPAPSSVGLWPYDSACYGKLDKLRTAAKLEQWPHDALRHSYGSFAYDLTDNAALVCARMGHRSDGMLFAHYKALVRKGDGLKFFSLLPPTEAGNVIPMPAPAQAANA